MAEEKDAVKGIMCQKLYNSRKDALEYIKKVTKKGRPISRYVTDEYFPVQDNSLIGTEITIRYRKCIPSNHIGETIIYETRHCLVLRCDKDSEPNMFIGWIKNTSNIIVGKIHYKDKEPPAEGREIVLPVFSLNGNQNEFMLISTSDFYTAEIIPGSDPGNSGIIIKADQGNSDNVVIAEEIGNNVIRFVLGDECVVVLKDYKPEPIAPRLNTQTFIETMQNLLNNNTIYKSPFE